MSKTFKTLLFAVDDSGICTITIHRPNQLNALNNRVFVELDEVLDDLGKDATIRALIITGSEEKAFAAGADVKEFADFSSSEAKKLSLRGQGVFQKIEDLTIPVLAAINGYALGGGLELALACHLRIASINAVLGFPEVSLGLIPGYGGTQRLTNYVGKPKALELILSGRFINTEEALSLGVINTVTEEDLIGEAKKMLHSMIKQAPLALKNAILAVKEAGSSQGFENEAILFGDLFNTTDFKEGTTAFIEKRKPNFFGK